MRNYKITSINKLLLLSILLFLVSGCGLIDKLTQFNIDFDETVVIPATTIVNLPISLNTPDIETNSESVFSVNDTRKDLIEEILLTELKLTVVSPANEDFSFLKSIEVFITADNLSDVRVAWKDNVPVGTSELFLDLTDEDLKEFIKKDKFKIELNVTTDETINSEYTIDIHSVFYVDAKILGV